MSHNTSRRAVSCKLYRPGLRVLQTKGHPEQPGTGRNEPPFRFAGVSSGEPVRTATINGGNFTVDTSAANGTIPPMLAVGLELGSITESVT